MRFQSRWGGAWVVAMLAWAGVWGVARAQSTPPPAVQPAAQAAAQPVTPAASSSPLSERLNGDVLGFHLVSQHFPRKDYNNFNPGVYYRLKEEVVAGVYLNSLRRTSAYVGYTWHYKGIDLTLGGVTGYKHAAQLLLVPSVELYSTAHYTARLAFIPQVEKRIGSHVLHLMVEYR